jgi:hypothetical protein
MKFLSLDFSKEKLLNFYTVRVLVLWFIGLLYFWISSDNRIRNTIGLTLLFMLIKISIIGFVIFHIYPRYIYFPVNKYYVEDSKSLFWIDLLLHQLPLIIHLVLLYYGVWNFDKKLILVAMLLNTIFFIIYLLFVNPFDIYIPRKAQNIKLK